MKKKRKPKYLDAEKKAYYLAELQKAREIVAVDEITADWKMDERIEPLVWAINRFECFQTLSSCFPRTIAHAVHRPIYIQVAITREADRRITQTLREIARRTEGDTIVWSVDRQHAWQAEEAAFTADDVPEALRHLDILVNQKKYCGVENVFVFLFLRPGSGLTADQVLSALSDAWHAIVKAFEAVGEALELETAAA